MGVVPEARVEIAPGTRFVDNLDTATWVDVSTRFDTVAGYNIGFGRADELEAAGPNTLTGVRLFNQDGAVTPTRVLPGAAGSLGKGTPIRVSVRYPGGDWRVRFTGYVDEVPVTWPAGGDEECVVEVTATSRKARLGSGRTLESHIRTEFLSTAPTAYWPLTETDLLDRAERPSFRDLTKQATTDVDSNVVASFVNKGSYPVLNDGSPGPVDETSLVRFDGYANEALIGDLYRYIGGTRMQFQLGSQGFYFECLARVIPTTSDEYYVTLMTLQTRGKGGHMLSVGVQQDPAGGFRIYMQLQWRDPETGTLRGEYGSPYFTPGDPTLDAMKSAVLSGQIHHYAIYVSPGRDLAGLLFDGELIVALSLNPSFLLTAATNEVVIGQNTWQAFAWVGHAAVHNRVITQDELDRRVAVATASEETLAEKMRRVLGRAGVPAAEVQVSDRAGFIDRLLPAPEAGRTVLEVADTVMSGLGGVLHDDTLGRPRVHLSEDRYNTTPAVTLSTNGQEIDQALEPVEDDRYLVNSVETTQETTGELPIVVEDDDSIDTYGFYRVSRPVARAYRSDMRDMGRRLLRRYKAPEPRYRTVPVDVGDLPAEKRDVLLDATVGTLLELTGLPAQAPQPTERLYVEGYAEVYSLNGGHQLAFNTTPGDDPPVVLLNDPVYSLLDAGNVTAI